MRFIGRLIYLSAYFISALFPKKCPVQRLEVIFFFFPACFSAWQFQGEILCSKMLSGEVLSHLRLSPHHVLWLETPVPFPHTTETGGLPSHAMQLSAVYEVRTEAKAAAAHPPQCWHCRDPCTTTLTLCQELYIAARCALSSCGPHRGGQARQVPGCSQTTTGRARCR